MGTVKLNINVNWFLECHYKICTNMFERLDFLLMLNKIYIE
jgi:hypothetical protein